MNAVTPEQLDVRRELMIAGLNDWTESVDPCEHGHVEHGPEAHQGRHLVHSISRSGFGADWDYEEVVAFIRTAREVSGVVETQALGRAAHVPVIGADGRLMFFDFRPRLAPQSEEVERT